VFAGADDADVAAEGFRVVEIGHSGSA
jgi:hypothetical protein